MSKVFVYMPALLLLLGMLPAPSLADEECVGEYECYDRPDSPSSRSDSDSESNPIPSDPAWPNDSRLNPVPDEYYTIYCEFDLIRVWASLPDPREVGSITLLRMLAGPFPFDAGNGLSVNLIGDIVTIYGANGNGPSHPGSKSFSLQRCLERNGTPHLLPAVTPMPTPTSEPRGVVASPRRRTVLTLESWALLMLQIVCMFAVPSIVVAPGSWWLRHRKK